MDDSTADASITSFTLDPQVAWSGVQTRVRWTGTFESDTLNQELRRFVFRDVRLIALLSTFLGASILWFVVVGGVVELDAADTVRFSALGAIIIGGLCLEGYIHLRASPMSYGWARVRQLSAAFIALTFCLAISAAYWDSQLKNRCRPEAYDVPVGNITNTSFHLVERWRASCVHILPATVLELYAMSLPSIPLYPAYNLPLVVLSWGLHAGSFLWSDYPVDPGFTLELFVINMVVISVFACGAVWLRVCDHRSFRDRLLAVTRAEAARRRSAAEVESVDALLLATLPEPVLDRLASDTGLPSVADYAPDGALVCISLLGIHALANTAGGLEAIRVLNARIMVLDQLCVDTPGVEKALTTGDSYWVMAGVPCRPQAPAVAAALFAFRAHSAVGRPLGFEPSGGGDAQTQPLSDPPSNGTQPSGLSSTPFIPLSEASAKIVVRIAIHTGPLHATVLGSSRLTYEPYGPSCDSVALIAQHCPAGKVAITDVAHSQLGQELISQVLLLAEDATTLPNENPLVVPPTRQQQNSPAAVEEEDGGSGDGGGTAAVGAPGGLTPADRRELERIAALSLKFEAMGCRCLAATLPKVRLVVPGSPSSIAPPNSRTPPHSVDSIGRIPTRLTPHALTIARVVHRRGAHGRATSSATTPRHGAASSSSPPDGTPKAVAIGFRAPGPFTLDGCEDLTHLPTACALGGHDEAPGSSGPKSSAAADSTMLGSGADGPQHGPPSPHQAQHSARERGQQQAARLRAGAKRTKLVLDLLRDRSVRQRHQRSQLLGGLLADAPSAGVKGGDQASIGTGSSGALGIVRPAGPSTAEPSATKRAIGDGSSSSSSDCSVGDEGVSHGRRAPPPPKYLPTAGSSKGPYSRLAPFLIQRFRNPAAEAAFEEFAHEATAEVRRASRIIMVALVLVLLCCLVIPKHDDLAAAANGALVLCIALVVAVLNVALVFTPLGTSVDPFLAYGNCFLLLLAAWLAPDTIVGAKTEYLFPVPYFLVTFTCWQWPGVLHDAIAITFVISAAVHDMQDSVYLRSGTTNITTLLARIVFIPIMVHVSELRLRRHFTDFLAAKELAEHAEQARVAQTALLESFVPMEILRPMELWLQFHFDPARAVVFRRSAALMAIRVVPVHREDHAAGVEGDGLRMTEWLRDVHRVVDGALEQCELTVKVRTIGTTLLLAGPFPVTEPRCARPPIVPRSSAVNVEPFPPTSDVESIPPSAADRASIALSLSEMAYVAKELVEHRVAEVRATMHVGPVVAAVMGMERIGFDVFGVPVTQVCDIADDLPSVPMQYGAETASTTVPVRAAGQLVCFTQQAAEILAATAAPLASGGERQQQLPLPVSPVWRRVGVMDRPSLRAAGGSTLSVSVNLLTPGQPGFVSKPHHFIDTIVLRRRPHG